jgi:hypothetical protein
MNASQVRSTPSFCTLPAEAKWSVARAGANRLVRIRVVILRSPVFGRWIPRHQLRQLHKPSIQQATGDTGEHNQHQSEHSGSVGGFEHVSSC